MKESTSKKEHQEAESTVPVERREESYENNF